MPNSGFNRTVRPVEARSSCPAHVCEPEPSQQIQRLTGFRPKQVAELNRVQRPIRRPPSIFWACSSPPIARVGTLTDRDRQRGELGSVRNSAPRVGRCLGRTARSGSRRRAWWETRWGLGTRQLRRMGRWRRPHCCNSADGESVARGRPCGAKGVDAGSVSRASWMPVAIVGARRVASARNSCRQAILDRLSRQRHLLEEADADRVDVVAHPASAHTAKH